jgi:hypothetical protein
MLCLALMACLAGTSLPAHATTKGLNQIVTPDIQPLGVLSTSCQMQNPAIGDSAELQLELGITKNFEIAAFQGFSPGATVLNCELGLVQRKSFLLSAGVLGIQKGLKPQPFLEGGYYWGKMFAIAGVQEQDSVGQGVFGFGYQCMPRALITFDYITGNENFATAGVTFTLTPNLSFNPAIYIANSTPHHDYAYGVLTWNSKLW